MSSYRFGRFVLDAAERRLLCDGRPVPLTPKVFDTLVFLVERHGRLVGKDDLMAAMWGGSHVEEGSVSRTIHVLRKALATADGDTELEPQFIETIPTKGYRFVADVTTVGKLSSFDETVAAVPVEQEVKPQAEPNSRRRLFLGVAALLVFGLAGSAWLARAQYGSLGSPRQRGLTPPTAVRHTPDFKADACTSNVITRVMSRPPSPTSKRPFNSIRPSPVRMPAKRTQNSSATGKPGPRRHRAGAARHT